MRRIGAFAVFVLLVAGCTSSADPSPASSPVSTPGSSTPQTTAPPSPSVPADVPTTGPNAEPGERPPVMPVAATQHTAAGAKAFAEFFIKTIDWGYATISGAYLRHYSADNCTTCLSLAYELDRSRKLGHRYIGGRSTVLSARAGRGGALRSQIVTISSTSFEEVDKHGKFVSGDRAYTAQRFELEIRWSHNIWRVTSVAIIQ